MKIAFYTLGCKVNQYETEAMREKFAQAGFEVLSDLSNEESEGVTSDASNGSDALDALDASEDMYTDSADDASEDLHADGTDDASADVYVINTCTVTHLADRKSRQFIRRAKRQNPNALIAVTGCYAQVDPETVASIEGVDLIVGTNEKQDIVRYVEEELLKNNRLTDKTRNTQELTGSKPGIPDCGTDCCTGVVSDGDATADMDICGNTEKNPAIHVRKYGELSDYCSDGIIKAMESRTRAYIKIQEGCNRFCSYCIIPYARGRVRSRDEAEIIEEARGLVAAGFKEIVLTGINTALYGAEKCVGNCEEQCAVQQVWNDAEKSSYNVDRSAETDKSREFGLRSLLRKLDELPGDFRVRLSSLEPTVVSPKDVESILDSQRLCPHLHLSIQSGSDNVLRAMNRRYTREEYLEIVDLLRGRKKVVRFDSVGVGAGVGAGSSTGTDTDCSYELERTSAKCGPLFGITTDIIVGFPGETDADFSDTVELVRTAGFSKVHVFRYSPRRGTKAAEMGDQVAPAVKAARAETLMEEAEMAARRFMETMIGERVRVLLEEVVEVADADAGADVDDVDVADADVSVYDANGISVDDVDDVSARDVDGVSERNAKAENARNAVGVSERNAVGVSVSAVRNSRKMKCIVGYSDNYTRVYIPIDGVSAQDRVVSGDADGPNAGAFADVDSADTVRQTLVADGGLELNIFTEVRLIKPFKDGMLGELIK